MRFLGRALWLLALGVAGAWIVHTYLYEPVIVESASMEPTLHQGIHYLVNRWVYRQGDPQRGDMISFVSPVDHETRYIKRIIALPGDTVELKDKHVLLNGRALEEPYTIYLRSRERLDGDNLGPLKVPEDMYFVLGDNRDVSYDSTAWRDAVTKKPIYFLPRENIKGRVKTF